MQIQIAALQTASIWGVADLAPALEIYADQPFITNDLKLVPAGSVERGDFRHRVVGSVTDGVATFPLIDAIDTTEDSLTNQLATYSAYIRVAGQEPVPLLLNFPLAPINVPGATLITDWARIEIHKHGITARRSNDVYTKQQTDDAIQAAITSPLDASTTVKGIAKLSVAPSLATSPIAVGDNDPRLTPLDATALVKGVTRLSVAPIGAPIAVGVNDPDYLAAIEGGGARQVFDVTDYGAECDWAGGGTGTDDTAAVLAALADCLAANGALYFPAFCLVSGSGAQILLVNKAIEIFGNSRSASGLVVASSVPTTRDAIHVVPPATGSTGANWGAYAGRNNRGYYFHDFSILNDTGTSPAGNGGGRNAIRVTTTAAGASWHDCVIERVDLLRLSNTHSLVFNNESSPGVAANVDGIRNIMIHDCMIFDGFLGQFISDHVVFSGSQFREFTSNQLAVDVYHVHDAIALALRNCLIYNKFGVRYRSGQKPVIDNCLIEAPEAGPVQGTDGAILNLKGDIEPIEAAAITNNRLHGRSGEPALNCVVRVDNASDTFFGINYFVAPAGQPAIRPTANAVRTRVQTVILDASHDNSGGPFPTPLLGTDTQYNAAVYFAPLSALAIPSTTPGYFHVEEVRPLRINMSDTTAPAWNADYRPVMIGANSSAIANHALGGATSLQLTQNAFLDTGGVWRYISTGPASNISFAGGDIVFRTAPSGSAAAAITWQTAFRMNSAGFTNETVGANVASAGSITPPSNFFTITGTTTISTITVLSTAVGTVLHMITASSLTFDEAGNITVLGGTSLTTEAGQLVIAAWDGTKWRLR